MMFQPGTNIAAQAALGGAYVIVALQTTTRDLIEINRFTLRYNLVSAGPTTDLSGSSANSFSDRLPGWCFYPRSPQKFEICDGGIKNAPTGPVRACRGWRIARIRYAVISRN